MRRYDYLIVGAGLTGSVLAERLASQLGKRVLVIDRRAHPGGNVYDEDDEHGVRVHRYGPHLFHTNSETVVRYLSQFTAWHPYEHRVLGRIADHDGVERLVPVPFNLASLHALYPKDQADRLEARLLATYGEGANVPILKLRETADPDLHALAEFVYERVFYGYTLKHWGCPPDALGPHVTARVPVRVSRDDRYFQDDFQALPRDGYTAMVERILDHPGIDLETGVAFEDARDTVRFNRLIYTGPIDAFFDEAYGALPYRSLRFHFEHTAAVDLDGELGARGFAQPVAQVNHPALDVPFTRVTEFKHATGQRIAGTTVAREFPEAYTPGTNEPYYPVPAAANRAQYARYVAEAASLASVTFAGRLADYKYYNMDQAVARALSVFERDLVPSRRS
ncbi:MAG: UDP-galactopyranose mutase [Bacteroidota bacterium]